MEFKGKTNKVVLLFLHIIIICLRGRERDMLTKYVDSVKRRAIDDKYFILNIKF